MLQTILSLLSQTKAAQLIFKEQTFSAEQLVNRAREIINQLEKINLTATDRLAFCLPNTPELLSWYLACFHQGIPVVPIIYEHDAAFIEQVLQLTHPAFLITTKNKLKEFTDIHLPKGCRIGIDDDNFQAILASTSAHASLTPAKPSADSLAMIIFSSGTSGVLKGIQHSYQSAWGFMQTLVEILAVNEGLIYLVAQSMGHIGGITTTLITLLHEGKAILLEHFEVNTYMQAIQRYQPTHLNLHTPLFYELLDFPHINKTGFSRCITCFAGGDTIPTELPIKFSAATGAKMQIGYGMTETGIVIINRDPYGKYAGSCGIKIKIAEIELRDAHNKVVKPGEIGELWIKSPGCCTGYWDNHTLEQKTFADGWFRTCDLARVDAEGYYWYMGRDNQVIHYDNHLIYPAAIEKILFECPEINAAAVVAKKSEGPVAFVELKANQQTNNIERIITQNIAKKLQRWEIPTRIVVLNKLPLNLTGKIDREKLEEML